MSVARKRFKTALPKEPVPPVIMRVLLAKRDMWCPPLFSSGVALVCNGVSQFTVKSSIIFLYY